MRKFKVGDIVTGTCDSYHYFFTTSEATMRVVEVLPYSRINVEIIGHKAYPEKIGESYQVKEDHFELAEGKTQAAVEPPSSSLAEELAVKVTSIMDEATTATAKAKQLRAEAKVLRDAVKALRKL